MKNIYLILSMFFLLCSESNSKAQCFLFSFNTKCNEIHLYNLIGKEIYSYNVIESRKNFLDDVILNFNLDLSAKIFSNPDGDPIDQTNIALDFENLLSSKGVYILECVSLNNKLTKRFVVQ